MTNDGRRDPVDLDALEHWTHDNQKTSKFTIDAGINVDDAKKFRAAIAELRELRAWKERLGPVEGWFPSLSGIEGYPSNLPWDKLYGAIEEARSLLRKAHS